MTPISLSGMEAGVRGSQQWRSGPVLRFLEVLVLGRDAGESLAEGTGGRVEGGKHHWPSESGIETDGRGGTILSLQGPHGGDTANTILNNPVSQAEGHSGSETELGLLSPLPPMCSSQPVTGTE